MKRNILNRSKIRITANGQSVVEGSFAKVNAIEGNSIVKNGVTYNSTIKGIYSQNRNFVANQSDVVSTQTGLINLSQDLIDLINDGQVDTIYIKQKYMLKSFKYYTNLKLTFRLIEENGTQKSWFTTQEVPIGSFIERKLVVKIDSSKKYVKEYNNAPSLVWFNDYGEFSSIDNEFPFVSLNNQIEISQNFTRYTEQKTSQLDFPERIILRSSLDGTTRDIYFPELGKIVRKVDSSNNPISSPQVVSVTPIAFSGYRVYNNGYEKMFTDTEYEDALNYGAVPIVYTEYLQEERQGGDFSRFDFFMIDGESFCGIGYEQLKTTNQLTYEQSPSRQSDGSMENIEDYNSFVIGAGDIGFSLINPETYKRLKEKLISKRTFEVSYYDKDFDTFVTKEMYVKPIDLDNFLSLGDSIIGMKGFTIAFVPTLNENTEYTATFYNADNSVIGTEKAMFGRPITTLEVPNGYNYWLIKENGFNSGLLHTIKGNKKLNLFGNATLIAIK